LNSNQNPNPKSCNFNTEFCAYLEALCVAIETGKIWVDELRLDVGSET